MGILTKQYFVERGKVKSRYEPDERYNGNKRECCFCKRKHMSYPDTCKDGWKIMRGEMVSKKDCINFKRMK